MECGMSNEIGPVYISDEKSAETRKIIDSEITKMLREAHKRVTDMLVSFCCIHEPLIWNFPHCRISASSYRAMELFYSAILFGCPHKSLIIISPASGRHFLKAHKLFRWEQSLQCHLYLYIRLSDRLDDPACRCIEQCMQVDPCRRCLRLISHNPEIALNIC